MFGMFASHNTSVPADRETVRSHPPPSLCLSLSRGRRSLVAAHRMQHIWGTRSRGIASTALGMVHTCRAVRIRCISGLLRCLRKPQCRQRDRRDTTCSVRMQDISLRGVAWPLGTPCDRNTRPGCYYVGLHASLLPPGELAPQLHFVPVRTTRMQGTRTPGIADWPTS